MTEINLALILLCLLPSVTFASPQSQCLQTPTCVKQVKSCKATQVPGRQWTLSASATLERRSVFHCWNRGDAEDVVVTEPLVVTSGYWRSQADALAECSQLLAEAVSTSFQCQ